MTSRFSEFHAWGKITNARGNWVLARVISHERDDNEARGVLRRVVQFGSALKAACSWNGRVPCTSEYGDRGMGICRDGVELFRSAKRGTTIGASKAPPRDVISIERGPARLDVFTCPLPINKTHRMDANDHLAPALTSFIGGFFAVFPGFFQRLFGAAPTLGGWILGNFVVLRDAVWGISFERFWKNHKLGKIRFEVVGNFFSH